MDMTEFKAGEAVRETDDVAVEPTTVVWDVSLDTRMSAGQKRRCKQTVAKRAAARGLLTLQVDYVAALDCGFVRIWVGTAPPFGDLSPRR